MIRSMYSAVSGLNAHRTMLDVVGDNIANTSTNGFKRSSTVFESVLYETVNQPTVPGAEIGGTNPSQIGLGVAVSRIATDFTQGAMQYTGRQFDFALGGDGFFVTENPAGLFYTRAGSFSLDANGRLVTTEGSFVQGWAADNNGQFDTNNAVAPITLPVGEVAPPRPTGNVTIGGNLPSETAIGEFFSTAVEVFNQLGESEVVTVTFTKTNANEWTASAEYGDPATPIVLTDEVITFDASGQVATPADFGIDIAAGAIPGFDAITLDIGADVGALTQFGELSTMAVLNQDGYTAGMLTGISVSKDGIIIGTFSNGTLRELAQFAVATFANPEGLSKGAGSVFSQTVNSGDPQLAAAGTGPRGMLTTGSLEMSNVDLAEEFVDLISAQRGFQANSRVVTSSDELLSEIVNLKR